MVIFLRDAEKTSYTRTKNFENSKMAAFDKIYWEHKVSWD